MKRGFFTIGHVALLAGIGGVLPLSAGASTIDITMQTSTTTVILNSMFNGLSYDKGDLAEKYFDVANTDQVGLFERLGPGVVRIGAYAVDYANWDPTGPGRVSTSTICPSDVDRLAAFLRATQWKAIYGINFLSNTSTGAVSEAQYVTQSLGDRLLGFEIGNEPENYRPAISDSQFRAQWEVYANAIRAALPQAVLTGPAAGWDVTNVVAPFAAAESNLISLLTFHYYRANGESSSSTMSLLLSPDPALTFKDQTTSTAVGQNGISGGFRIDECNSLYNGGRLGVSNAFGSALWALDFMFAVAATPYSTGVNFHGGYNGPYTPIESDEQGDIRQARPIYYGLLTFAQMANGTLLNTTVSSSTTTLSAYSVAMNDGSISVLLNNKSATDNAAVSIHPNALTFLQATGLLLTSLSLDSTSQVTLGGSAVNPDGTWTPTYTAAPVVNQLVSVTVPAASALLVNIQTAPIMTLPDPDLSGLPSSIPVNGSVSVGNGSAYSNVSFYWSLTPNPAGGSTAGTSSASFIGGASASLANTGLLPGSYTVSVYAVSNTNGAVSPTSSKSINLVSDSLSGVRVYPNPWRDDKDSGLPITFDRMPDGASIKIFNVSAHLVRTLSSSGGSTTWDLNNDSGHKVASGLYLYLISDTQGNRTRGKLNVIR